MAQTLALFREGARERERLERETAAQRHLLETSIETISEGFVLFDAGERLVMANSRFREMIPGIAVIGMAFDEMLDALVARGMPELNGLSATAWRTQGSSTGTSS